MSTAMEDAADKPGRLLIVLDRLMRMPPHQVWPLAAPITASIKCLLQPGVPRKVLGWSWTYLKFYLFCLFNLILLHDSSWFIFWKRNLLLKLTMFWLKKCIALKYYQSLYTYLKDYVSIFIIPGNLVHIVLTFTNFFISFSLYIFAVRKKKKITISIPDTYRQVWMRLNSLFPRRLWAMSVEGLQPEQPQSKLRKALTEDDIILDPLYVLRCDPRVNRWV